MAVTPDSEIRLLKCNLNLDNNNQINFATTTAQYNYFNGLTKKTQTACSYQRKDNYIRWPEHIDDIIEYNYVMYKNTHYDSKWFYAYVTKMEYENDNCTRIYIKTDVFQTWQFNLTYMQSFIEREHVNSDTIGSHTVPENLETGDYIINSTDSILEEVNNYTIIGLSSVRNSGLTYSDNGVYNNVLSGCYLFTFSSSSDAKTFIKILDQKGVGESVAFLYMIPATLYNKLQKGGPYSYSEGDYSCSYYTVQSTTATILESNKTVSINSTIDGYTPKNNKLFTYPYNYLEIDNNNGNSAIYKYELFVNNAPIFQVAGAITPGCSIMCWPINYNKITDTHALTSGMLFSYNDGIPAGKYPIGAWMNDTYTNWLTQSSVNRITSEVGSSLNAIGAAANGNAMGTINGLMGIINNIESVYTHSFIPDVSKGNVNSGDVTFAMGQTLFAIKKKSIKAEYARIIDKFWSMYGYKVNEVKTPNITGRSNWNYVKMVNPNIEGYIPQEDLQEIKDLFSNGITIWHTTTHFLDYSQTNSII